MAGHTDREAHEGGGTPVPDLIERYRLRRDAWIAQADELARLRDEVRGSAEREAMEIVTAARQNVRQVITDARRELLVLSAQVQAALGEVNAKTDPAALLHKAGISLSEDARAHTLSLTASAEEPAFAPESAVDEILSEVHEDMTALAEDARALPMQVVPPLKPASIPAPMTAAPTPVPPQVVVPVARPYIEPPAPVEPATRTYTEPPTYTAPALSEAASHALLSSQFPSEAVPVPAPGRLRMFVGVFVGIGVVVVLGTMWWLRTPRVGGEVAVATESRTNTPTAAPATPEIAAPAETPVPGAPDLAASTAPAANLSLVAEAIRDVWVRTTIDGQTDQGRTLTAGQVIDVSAEQSVSLRVGDAGAIVVSVNHGQKEPLGHDGQVITRQFVVEGAPAKERAPSAPVVPAPAAPARGPVGPPIASKAPVVPSPVAKAAPAPVQPLPAPAVPPMPTSTAASTATAPVVGPAVVTTPPVAAPARPEPAPSAPAAATSPATAVVAAARQWLDAYHRQDRAAMAALSTDNLLLADERRSDERFPPGLGDVTRTLDRVSVQIAADTAVLTAVMTEQSTTVPMPRVSPVSQVWVLAGGGQWKVRQARFVSEARLNQVFR